MMQVNVCFGRPSSACRQSASGPRIATKTCHTTEVRFVRIFDMRGSQINAGGHSKLDAIRALKRYIAREVFHIIARRHKEINQTGIAA
jgi:transposase